MKHFLNSFGDILSVKFTFCIISLRSFPLIVWVRLLVQCFLRPQASFPANIVAAQTNWVTHGQEPM